MPFPQTHTIIARTHLEQSRTIGTGHPPLAVLKMIGELLNIYEPRAPKREHAPSRGPFTKKNNKKGPREKEIN